MNLADAKKFIDTMSGERRVIGVMDDHTVDCVERYISPDLAKQALEMLAADYEKAMKEALR